MLYILGVNQPKLATGRQPVTSRGKGNPMKVHARHVPGSTPSRRTPSSRSILHSSLCIVPLRKCDRYATKMRPNFKTKILIRSASAAYNFAFQKWSHFLATERFPLPRGEGQGEGQTGFLALAWAQLLFPLLRGEGQGEGQTGTFQCLRLPWQQNCNYCTESAHPPIYYRFDHAVPATYENQNQRPPIFQGGIP